MHVEISVALNFVISYMYNKLPRRRVDVFGEILEKGLKSKFEGHWYPEKPFKGSAFRCIRVSDDEMDPVVAWAAVKCGLDVAEIREYLPRDLTIWIDPSEVSYRIGEKGAVKILYSDRRTPGAEDTAAMDKEVQNANRGFNPEAQSFRPIDSLSSSLTNLSLSPSPNGWGSISPPGSTPSHIPASTSPVTPFLARNNNRTTFTAAAFAATKFGSTKLKSQAKRPSRLSPTEFGAYVKQRSGFQIPSPGQHPMISNGYYTGSPNGVTPILPGMHSPLHGQPRSLSPRNARQDYIDQQHRLMLLQQQGYHQKTSPYQSSYPFGSLSPQSPVEATSLSDLYQSFPQSSPVAPSSGANGSSINPDLLGSSAKNSSASDSQGTPSPSDQSKTFLDSLNWNTLSPYANLQHLLVAN